FCLDHPPKHYLRLFLLAYCINLCENHILHNIGISGIGKHKAVRAERPQNQCSIALEAELTKKAVEQRFNVAIVAQVNLLDILDQHLLNVLANNHRLAKQDFADKRYLDTILIIDSRSSEDEKVVLPIYVYKGNNRS